MDLQLFDAWKKWTKNILPKWWALLVMNPMVTYRKKNKKKSDFPKRSPDPPKKKSAKKPSCGTLQLCNFPWHFFLFDDSLKPQKMFPKPWKPNRKNSMAEMYTPPLKTNMTGWKIPMFNRKYMFKWWIFHCHVLFFGGILPLTAPPSFEDEHFLSVDSFFCNFFMWKPRFVFFK